MAADGGVNQRASAIAVCQRQVEPRHQFMRRADGADVAGVEQDHVVSQTRYFVECMAHVQHRNVKFAVQLFEVGQDFGLALRVERGQRLVQKQQARAGGQGARDRHTLTLAARQGVGSALQQMADAEQADDLIERDAALRRRHALESKRQVLRHAQVREQVGILKHVADGASVHRHKDALRIVLPDFAFDGNERLAVGVAAR